MSSANLSVAEAALKRPRKSKASHKRGRPRARAGSPASGGEATTSAAAGTLTRTKALLLAALKVWELKHRIND